MYALVEKYKVKTFFKVPPLWIDIGDTRYPHTILKMWKQQERENLGIYEFMEPLYPAQDVVKENFVELKPVYDQVNHRVTAEYELTPKPQDVIDREEAVRAEEKIQIIRNDLKSTDNEMPLVVEELVAKVLAYLPDIKLSKKSLDLLAYRKTLHDQLK